MGVFCAILALLFLLVVLMGATLGGSGAEAARRNLWSVVPLLLLAPAAEELYFRGLLLDHLTRRFGPGAAICFVSGLFGLVHWPQGHALPMMVLSLALCAATLYSGSVIWAIVLHAAWNGLALYHNGGGPAGAVAAAGSLLVLVGAAALGFLDSRKRSP